MLFIDDRQSEFDTLKRVLDTEKIFEIVNEEPIFDEGSSNVLTREEQKEKIINLMRTQKYSIVLFDLTLRNGREEQISKAMADNLLSVEIYKEMKEWLSENNKKFVFVTSHSSWKTENEFRKIGDDVKDALFLRKAIEGGEHTIACVGFDKHGKTMCGEKWNSCSYYSCFNKKLRRLVNDD